MAQLFSCCLAYSASTRPYTWPIRGPYGVHGRVHGL